MNYSFFSVIEPNFPILINSTEGYFVITKNEYSNQLLILGCKYLTRRVQY